MDAAMNGGGRSVLPDSWLAIAMWLLERPTVFDKQAYYRYARPNFLDSPNAIELHGPIRIWIDRYLLGIWFGIGEFMEQMRNLTCTCKDMHLAIERAWALHTCPWVEAPLKMATDVGLEHVMFDMIMIAWTFQHVCGEAMWHQQDRMLDGRWGGLNYIKLFGATNHMVPPRLATELIRFWKDMAALQATCYCYRRLFRLALEPWAATAMETPLYDKLHLMVSNLIHVEWLRRAGEIELRSQVEDEWVEERLFVRMT